jgi:hypothetical protein
MCKPGGNFSLSTWHYEAWNNEVKAALATLPNPAPWPETSDEFSMAWATGPWHSPNYVKSMLLARGFMDVKAELLPAHVLMRDAEDFYYMFEGLILMTSDKYWTDEQKKRSRPLVKEAVIREVNNRNGEGTEFTTERCNIMATGRKPDVV